MIIPFCCNKPGSVTVTLIDFAEAVVDTLDVEDAGTVNKHRKEADFGIMEDSFRIVFVDVFGTIYNFATIKFCHVTASDGRSKP